MATRKGARPRRARPGTGKGGEYYRIEVRPRGGFVTFRYHDVGRPGHVLQLAGQRAGGSWDDVAWLISKKDAHIEDGRLVADTAGTRRILETVGPARRVKGNIFKGHPRKGIPEKRKPTPAQLRAWRRNIRKAQAARWKRAA